ncbi:HEAT repeat domain-containing protein [Leptolyngbya sp. AN02str]|uniref:HEAT repeat domain-containing protein n=1 Tax=Leptolyngbya sp. AN02str TaxID=3423363 RepID=UPI003D31DA2E
MALEWFAALGIELGGYVAKDILLPLVKDGFEGYVTDFLQGCISDAVGLASQEPAQKAVGQALKAFLVLVEDELEYADISRAEIRDFYEKPIKTFIHDDQVKPLLGKAFDPDCRDVDPGVLETRWAELRLKPLPDGFDMEQVTKQYLREVKGIVKSSPELKELLKLHNQEAIRRGVEELVGIPADFDLRQYQESLTERYGNLKLESLDTTGYAYNELKLWRMFIPQDVRTCQEFNPKLYEIPKERLRQLVAQGELDAAELLEESYLHDYHRSYHSQPMQPVLEVVGDTATNGTHQTPREKLVVILGDPGSGKSTLLQYLALQWAQQPIREVRELATRPLPLMIELRLYARDKQEGRCNSLLEFLDRGGVACHLNQRRLHEVLQQGHAIALFDGLDEVFDPAVRNTITTEIHRFTNTYPTVQTIVTSRWLGYKAQPLRDAGFIHYMLQDLTVEQIHAFIVRWHDETFRDEADKARKRDRLQRAITDSKAIRELAGNPLLLTMMAILNRNQELPRDRPELYNQASRVLLHQWDVERDLIEQGLDPITLDYRDKQAMLRQVAFHMQAGDKGLAGNTIRAEDLERILMAYLKTNEIAHPRETARRMIEQLRKRNFILCFLGAETYAFVHRTFLEYFAAWAFVWEFKETQTLSFDQLRDQTFGAHWQDESWHEVLRLIAGMIDPKFMVEIVQFLMEQKVEPQQFLDERNRLKPGGIGNLLLAAECLQEVRSPSVTATIAQALMQQLQQTTERESSPRFNNAAAQAILRSVALLGKDQPATLRWLKQCLELDRSSYLPESAVEAIAQFWKDDPDTLPMLKTRAQSDDHWAVRLAAVQELARGWKDDPDTLPMLKTRAQSDDDWAVRQTAVQELAREWKDDPDMLSIFKTRAQSDDDSAVRQAAVQELARGWKDDPDTLPWLKTRAQSDDNSAVRQAAVQELARGWKDDPDTLPWLKSRALSDNDSAVRQAAVQELARGWKDDPDTLPMLKSRALSDNDSAVRQAAVQELARGWKDDPDTLPWLKSRAQSDDHWAVRQAAVQELARGWKDDPDTLPWLKTRAQSDDDWAVRQAAVQELARGWKDDPDVFELLCRCTLDDPFGRKYRFQDNPRQVALQALVEHYPSHPTTRELLQDRAAHDPDEQFREWAAESLKSLQLQQMQG